MGHLGLGKSKYTYNEVCLPQKASIAALLFSVSHGWEPLQVNSFSVYASSQASHSVSSLTRRGVTNAGRCWPTASRDTSCVHSQYAVLRSAAWMWPVLDGSGWTVADTLSRSCFSLRLCFYSSAPAAEGWQEEQKTHTKGRTPSLCAPLLYSASDDSPPPTPIPLPKPNFLLITFLQPRTRALQKRYRGDPPGRLQGGPRLINWQPFDIVQSMRPPALQARATIVCFGPTALSSTLHTRHWAI